MDMNTNEIAEMHLCTDCLMWSANADDSGFCNCGVWCESAICDTIRNSPDALDIIDLGYSQFTCGNCRINQYGVQHGITYYA